MNATNKPSAAAGWLGWAIALLYGAHSVLTIRITRSEKTSLLREELRGYHYLIGVLLLVLIASRLLLWWRARPAVTIPGVSAGVQHLGRQFALATYLIMLVMPLIGLGQAWTEGLTVHLGPLLNVPSLVPADRAGWLFFGYFHSALGFGLLLLTMGATLFRSHTRWRLVAAAQRARFVSCPATRVWGAGISFDGDQRLRAG